MDKYEYRLKAEQIEKLVKTAPKLFKIEHIGAAFCYQNSVLMHVLSGLLYKAGGDTPYIGPDILYLDA